MVMTDCWHQVERTARRPHTCQLCLEPIEAGWRYIDGRGLTDGRWYRWPMHAGCERLLTHATVRGGSLASVLSDTDSDSIPVGAYRDGAPLDLITGETVSDVAFGIAAAIGALAGGATFAREAAAALIASADKRLRLSGRPVWLSPNALGAGGGRQGRLDRGASSGGPA